LTTIRRAYLENHEMVLIMEDDVSPALMWVRYFLSRSFYHACSPTQSLPSLIRI
jgi:hypothetical protein